MRCRTISDKGGGVYKCSEITITKFDENSPGSQCKPGGLV